MKAISVRRAELGMSQTELAERVPMDRTALSKLEHGRHKPSAPTLKRLADALQTTPTDLLILEEQLQHPKGSGRPRVAAKEWLEQEIGHSFLAFSDEAAEEAVANASSLEEVAALIEAVEDEYAVTESFLKHHAPPRAKSQPSPERELVEALYEALRKHMYWRRDLARRRTELRKAGEGEAEAVLVGMQGY